MAVSISFSNPSLSSLSSSRSSPLQIVLRALSDSESDSSKQNLAETKAAEVTCYAQPPASASTATASPKRPQKPVYSMKKGQIVRVDKEKYLNSVNYLSVDHPPYYKGLDYIYEDRGEVLNLRNFDTGEDALVAWVGIPTAPTWLPTEILIKSDKLDYERSYLDCIRLH